MSAIKFIQKLARKLVAQESKGITKIPTPMAAESKAGEIVAILQNAGLPFERMDEFIKSEKDLVKYLNIIESTRKSSRPRVYSGQEAMDQLNQLFPKKGEVFDMTGKRIRNTDRLMGGKEIPETDAEMIARMHKENKAAAKRMRNKKMVKDAIDNMSPTFVKGDRKYNAQLVADDLAEKRFGKDFYDLDQRQQIDLYDEAFTGLMKKYEDDLPMAKGGIARLGFKDGMTRRTFLKILGGAMSIPIIGKFLKPLKTAKGVTKVPMIKTDNVPGKPEWFDQLVNKVILEGDDVTKKFATGERQSIHQKTLDDGSVVRVTEDVDDGAVRVEYDSDANVFEDTVQMEYKKPLPDEGAPRPAAEFTTAESGPVGRQVGPDDFDIDIDEVGGSSISDLDSDVSKLKEYATGKKPTMKEFVQNKKRKDRARQITEDPEAQSDALIRRQGEALDYDDYASGGIARMLGE